MIDVDEYGIPTAVDKIMGRKCTAVEILIASIKYLRCCNGFENISFVSEGFSCWVFNGNDRTLRPK